MNIGETINEGANITSFNALVYYNFGVLDSVFKPKPKKTPLKNDTIKVFAPRVLID